MPQKPPALDERLAAPLVDQALTGMDDGELFIESSLSESLAFDDGRLKRASYDATEGFGLRGVSGEATGYAHATNMSEQSLKGAVDVVRAVKTGQSGQLALSPTRPNRPLYAADNPIDAMAFAQKVALLQDIDAYSRAADSKVVQVSAGLAAETRNITILRAGGETVRDSRPLVRLNVQVTMAHGNRMETGSVGFGGRYALTDLTTREAWQPMVDEALRQARVNLESVAAPAGEMPVVLGAGWCGILLHEAIGHGLEGDFNRKKTSAFAGLLGERVAAPGVTVVDDGTLEDRRGSLTIDDEGTPSERTVLIEDGILKGYMQDRLNARLMGMEPTGNGRRESYAHAPMPRMTNTYMLNGSYDPGEIIASVEDGLYAVDFGGGQVDITSGKFVFSCTETYRIRSGRIAEPVKGATLIGNGPDVLTKVSMIGNDMALDRGIGTCGKGGQSVPAGVGQPTLKIDRLTVGGTQAA